jgi:hypothetical protein
VPSLISVLTFDKNYALIRSHCCSGLESSFCVFESSVKAKGKDKKDQQAQGPRPKTRTGVWHF